MGKLLGTKYWGTFGVSTVWFAGMSMLYGAVLGCFLTILYILINALIAPGSSDINGVDALGLLLAWFYAGVAGGAVGAIVGGLSGLIAGGFSALCLLVYRQGHLAGKTLRKVLFCINPCLVLGVIFILFIYRNPAEFDTPTTVMLGLIMVVTVLATLHGTRRFLKSEQVGEGKFYVKTDKFPVEELFNQ